MGRASVNKKAKTIELKSNTNKEFFLIHGYSGSPTVFNHLPEYLYKKFNANVKIIRLKGHGTRVEDLDDFTEKDFLEQVEKELKKDLKKGNRIVLGGVSFGAQIALYLASKYPVEGVFNVVIPYKWKFPFNMKGLKYLSIFKKYWKKHLSEEEARAREKSFSYSYMHSNGLTIVKAMNKRLDKVFRKIICPCISIHSIHDGLGSYKSVEIIKNKMNSDIHRTVIFDEKVHNLFFSQTEIPINKLIVDFFKENGIFNGKVKREFVTAVIASYNEEKRISPVLRALSCSKFIKEIIVIDDGSADNTEKIVKKFKDVTYLKNKVNMGKAYSMNRGVKKAKYPMIFFCDADLRGFTSDIADSIILPVLNDKVDMFIGVRSNKMQKTVKAFAINSGERALRKKVWEKLPNYYKHRYRIECGLNTFVRKYGRGFDYEIFPYYQTLKESKYGFWRGMFLRWWLYWDVSMALMRFYFYDRFRKFDLD